MQLTQLEFGVLPTLVACRAAQNLVISTAAAEQVCRRLPLSDVFCVCALTQRTLCAIGPKQCRVFDTITRSRLVRSSFGVVPARSKQRQVL